MSLEETKRVVMRDVRRVACYPTWHEMLELELLRRSNVDMLYLPAALKACVEAGKEHAARWIRRCAINGIHPSNVYDAVVRYYEERKGLRSTWTEETT